MGATTPTIRPEKTGTRAGREAADSDASGAQVRNLPRPENSVPERKEGGSAPLSSGSGRPTEPDGALETLKPVELDTEEATGEAAARASVPSSSIEPETDPPATENTVDQSTAPWKSDAVLSTRTKTSACHDVEGGHPSSGLALISGRTLRLPAGARLIPGERVSILGRDFQMRQAPKSAPMIWAKWGGLGILSLLAVFGMAYLFGGSTGGTVSGVVVDRITGRIITSATVDVMNGPIVKTNAAGLYTVDDLPPGQYQIAASALGYAPQTGTVTRTGDKHAQLAFALMPLVVDSSEFTDGGTSSKSTDTGTPESDRPKIAYGHVALDVDFGGYLVFVDNILYGKNIDKVKRLTSGKHTITIQLEGFEDHATTVNVKARTTKTLTIAKADLTPKHEPIKRARKHFAAAKEHLDQRQWPAAIEAYDRGLEFNPDDATALQYRGWAHMKIGNTAKARDDLLRAAQLHGAGNQYLDAVACAGYLIEIDPDSPDGYRRRAEYHVTLTEYDKAINDYKAAIKRDKNSAKPRLGLAETYFVAGEYKDAAKEFDRARKLVEDPTDIYVRMLIALTRAGDDGRVRHKYKELSEFADPDRLQKLRKNPEWLRVLQIVDPMKRSEG